MAIDPAYDMPFPYYGQVGSFAAPIVPPASGPFDGTLVALPCINPDWLRLLLGAADQLRNPSSYKGLTPTQTVTILGQVQELLMALSVADPCVSCPLLRLQDCVLQSSCDGGATWVDAAGWVAGFSSCVSNVIIPPIPPNPGPAPIDQHACNIAGYIATEILQLSITKAVNDFNLHQSQIQYAQDILLTVAYAFPLTVLALDAFAVLYGEYSAITIGDFTAASTDPVLWSDVTCAIYSAIRTTGYIDAANLSTVVSNICAISYSSSTVITALCNFVSSLQLQDWQAFQNVGALDDVDCSSCASPPNEWCWLWDFSSSGLLWTATEGVWDGSIPAWRSVPAGSFFALDIQTIFPSSAQLVSVEISVYAGCTHINADGRAIYFADGSHEVTYPNVTGSHIYHISYPYLAPSLRVLCYESQCMPDATKLYYVKIRGTGTRPSFTTGHSCVP